MYVIEAQSMDKQTIINEIINNKELKDSPLLLTWICESDENRNLYIKYKNNYALMREGHSMSELEILSDLNKIKKKSHKSRKKFLSFSVFKYAAIIVVLVLGGYLYYSTFSTPKSMVTMNEVSFIKGKRNSFTLPDGSEVVLIKQSKIRYPSNFNDGNRKIYLDGEAYLDIVHNKNSPFRVFIGEHQIEVLGTEFFVSAYSQNKFIQVDLVSGKVKMNITKAHKKEEHDSYILNSNESLILNKNDRSIKQSEINDDFYAYWKEGEYIFRKESFESLAIKLERIYQVSIIFENEALSSFEFTGAIHASSSLKDVLDVFALASSKPFEYNVDDNTVSIKTIND